jgi:hypothetical protein
MNETGFLAAFERRIVNKGVHIERREYHESESFGYWQYVFAFPNDWHGQYLLSDVAIAGATAEGVMDENAVKFAGALADHAYERCWGEIAGKIVREMPR